MTTNCFLRDIVGCFYSRVSLDGKPCNQGEYSGGFKFPANLRLRLIRAFPWPVVCLIPAMSTLTFKVSRKSGEYVKPSLFPANHSAQSRFGLLDGVIVGFFAMCVCGLIYLLLHV